MGAGDDVFLNDVWKLYYHSPDDDDWRLESYVSIGMVSSVRDFWTAVNTVAPWMKDGMFFFMREFVQPVWDDPAVISGGCYSIRVPRENAVESMIDMMMAAAGETIFCEEVRDRWDMVCGISVSPKNSFNVIKVWLADGDTPSESQIWMPSCRTKDVFFSLFKDSIVRCKKPPPAPAPDQVTIAP
jgi:hypothetical protein